MRIITGVHRSGTSLLAQLVQSLGADFGPSQAIYEADEWNENGYLERRDVMDLNSRIVTGFARSTRGIASQLSKAVYITMPSREAIHKRSRRLRCEVEHLAASLSDLTVKDPRFCLTLPAWLETGEVESVLVSVRHPVEVAMSLRTRQRVPVRVGLRFWEYHMTVLLETIPSNGVLIDHAALIGSSPLSQLRRIATALKRPLSDAELLAHMSSVFAPSLHHETADPHVQLPQSTDRIWLEAKRALALYELSR